MNTNYEQTVKLWDETTETLNKLSYIAAGTITLSITFLGYILSIGPSARSILNTPYLHGMPIIYLLFLSWILLFLCVFFGIIVRLWNAKYLWNAHIHLWFTDLTEKSSGESKINLKSVADLANKGKDKYWKISKYVQHGTLIFFALGILTLMIFAIVVASGLASI